MEDEGLTASDLCDNCKRTASQDSTAESKSCAVCLTCSQQAKLRNLLLIKDSRIEDLEAQVSKLKQQLKESESQLLNGIGVLDKGSTVDLSNDERVVAPKPARSSEAQPTDLRPHVMLVGDNLFGKLRKAPHFIYEHLGRIPRLISLTKSDAGVLEMTRNAIETLSNENLPEREYHILWFGGLHDTTQEDYARKTFLERLVKSLSELRVHKRVLSVNWCTLPESAHNAEAREINEYIASWINEADNGGEVNAEGVAIRLVDLRYISRRDGTMEVNEAMWTPKGSKLVSESLKKVLNEKLQFTQKELDGIEASSRTMLEAREKKEKNKNERKARHEANLQEQQLRKQQKLAKQVLLRAGHSIPGSGNNNNSAQATNDTDRQPPKANKPQQKNHPRARKGGRGQISTKRKSMNGDSLPAAQRPFQNEYQPMKSDPFPSRVELGYNDGYTPKRTRVPITDYPQGYGSSSNPYYRREDYYRRSPPVSNSSPYDHGRYPPVNNGNMYNMPLEDQGRRYHFGPP